MGRGPKERPIPRGHVKCVRDVHKEGVPYAPTSNEL